MISESIRKVRENLLKKVISELNGEIVMELSRVEVGRIE